MRKSAWYLHKPHLFLAVYKYPRYTWAIDRGSKLQKPAIQSIDHHLTSDQPTASWYRPPSPPWPPVRNVPPTPRTRTCSIPVPATSGPQLSPELSGLRFGSPTGMGAQASGIRPIIIIEWVLWNGKIEIQHLYLGGKA